MVPTIYSTCFAVLSSVFKKTLKKIQGAHFFNLFPVYFCRLFFLPIGTCAYLAVWKMPLCQELIQDYTEKCLSEVGTLI